MYIWISVKMSGRYYLLRKFGLAIIILFLFFGICIFFPFFSICKAKDTNILYVGGNGLGDYSIIQDAIDNSSDNDTIYVNNGTYYENLIINKSINLIGQDKNSTFLVGNNSLYVILIKSLWINITEFTIKNGKIGAYIVGPDYSCNTIINNIFTENWEGIRLDNSSGNNISLNNIKNNTNFGIISYESNNNIIGSNTFIDNYKAILLGRWSDYNVVSGNNFTENSFAVMIDSSFNNIICKNSFYKNNLGISLSYSKTNNITENVIEFTKDYGIYISNSEDNTILPNTFFKNYIDIKEETGPPVVKTPGFEILFVFISILFILILKRYKY